MNFNLLIVDDDPNFLFMHKILAKRSGFHLDPKTFDSGKEVIEYLEQNKGINEKILIFLDLFMPEINGWSVADYVESLGQFHRIKIFIVSSSVNQADKQKALTYSSIIEYIEKPLELNYLETIKESPFF
ncbi:response regulator [Algoriphagus confluentis]|uniref:Response regulator n=1 Tax=Algoriphagus confluentis TaxID=1697556 RepID=A0ABQ6PP13_9BACT|nr:response regulator [Algoriphagus confluentis]